MKIKWEQEIIGNVMYLSFTHHDCCHGGLVTIPRRGDPIIEIDPPCFHCPNSSECREALRRDLEDLEKLLGRELLPYLEV